MTGIAVDVSGLYACLDRARQSAGMSWRALGRALGVSPSTFTRLSQGNMVDTETFLALVTWLGVDVADFTDGYVDRTGRINGLESQLTQLTYETERAHERLNRALARMDVAMTVARRESARAEGWERADAEHVRQLNIARDQLVENGIEPDRRIM
jgi:transcriptional regulator with XRE-family HTH domain